MNGQHSSQCLLSLLETSRKFCTTISHWWVYNGCNIGCHCGPTSLKMKKIDDTTKQHIVTLLQSNRSIENVAHSLEVSARTVGRIKKAFLPTFPTLPAGRPRILSTRTLRDINRKVLCGECTTGKAVMRRLQKQGIKICYQTVWNSLHSIGIVAKRKRKKPFLSKKHRIKRYRWAIAHRSWTLEDWKRVIFSDESRRPRLIYGTQMASSTAW